MAHLPSTDSLSPEPSVSRSLLRELVELRQVRLEKESLQQANLRYMALVANLELTISELKVHLQAKEAEINKLKTRVKKLAKRLERPVEEPTGGTTGSKEELTNRILTLEEENVQLKNHAALTNEMERLRVQLEQSNKMHGTYRGETKTKVVTLATDHSESSDSHTEHRISARKSPGSVSPRLDSRTPLTQSPPSRSKPTALSPNSAAMAFLIPESQTPMSCKTSVTSLKPSPKASFAVKGKSRPLVSHKSNIIKPLRKSQELRSPLLSAYIPSFTRSKRTETKPGRRSSPGARDLAGQGGRGRGELATVEDESEFPDFFPEEKELD